MPFSRVLLGLNIPKLGWVLAQSLARHFGNVDRLLAASQEEVEEVDGFGPDRAEIIVEWFEDEQNRALVEELRSLGLRFELGEEDKPKVGPLTGKTYVITGTLERWSREQAAAALEAAGAKVTNSVSAKTTALVVGEDPGASKVTKAEKAGVEQIDEAALERLLAGYGLREAVLGLAGIPPGNRAAVHQDREDVARAHVAGEGGGGVRSPRLGIDVSIRRPARHPVDEGSVDTGGGQGVDERARDVPIGERRAEKPRRRLGREPVVGG